MDGKAEEYLSAVERRLRALEPSERIDIISEIKSHIEEKQQDQHLDTGQILRDLGDPKTLAAGYVGDVVAKRKHTSMSQALRLAAFYSLTGLHGSIVIPFLAIMSWALYLSAGITVLACVVQLIFEILPFTAPFSIMNLGVWRPPTMIAVPLALVAAYFFCLGGKKLWSLLKVYLGKVSQQHRNIRDSE